MSAASNGLRALYSTSTRASISLASTSASLSVSFLRALSSTSTSPPSAPLETDVLISGAGPTGLTLSALLHHYGVPNLVVEKGSKLTDHPQAHYINNRTMEVFRALSGLDVEIQSQTPPLSTWRKFLYCEELLGRPFGEVDHFLGQSAAHDPSISPVGVAHLPQHRLMPLLLDRVKAHDRSRGHGETVLFSRELQSIQTHPDSVEVRTVDGTQIRARYLVGADGAHSKVRTLTGIQLEGQPALQHLINVYFTSPLLGRRLAPHGGMLYFVFNSKAIVVLVAHDLTRGEFVAQIPYFPPIQTPAQFTVDRCMDLLHCAIGSEAGADAVKKDVRIVSVRPWTMSAQVARHYRKGPVFLAGDSAHQFPPAGGFGMNTGVQDAHNLAWKLARVVQGAAPDSLLDSYEAERRHVGLCNAALSVSNWHEALRVPQALGLDPRAASLVTTVASAAVSAVRPLSTHGVASSAVSKAAEGVLQLGLAVSGLKGPLKLLRERQLRDVFDKGQSLRLQFPKEDLGFSHPLPPYAASGSAQDFIAKWKQSAEERAKPFVPEVKPGVRFPHLTLSRRGDDGFVSSIDALPWGATTKYTLVVNESRLPPSLPLDLAIRQAARSSLDVAVFSQSDLDQETADRCSAVAAEKSVGVQLYRDVERRLPTLPGADVAFVLVRPDGHVQWKGDDLTSCVV